jgi:hypothetical protein
MAFQGSFLMADSSVQPASKDQVVPQHRNRPCRGAKKNSAARMFTMKRSRLFLFIAGFIAAGVASVHSKQLAPEAAGNFFIFSDNAYVAHAGVESIEISVYFAPGDSSHSGWVNYSTRDGTALAGVDYAPVEGRLYFSGENELTFRVPILSGGFIDQAKRFQVVLSNPDALIWDDPATVVVQPAPRLETVHAGNHLQLSWPTEYKGYVLEQSPTLDFFSPKTLKEEPAIRENRWQIQQPLGVEPRRFYRLRRDVGERRL